MSIIYTNLQKHFQFSNIIKLHMNRHLRSVHFWSWFPFPPFSPPPAPPTHYENIFDGTRTRWWNVTPQIWLLVLDFVVITLYDLWLLVLDFVVITLYDQIWFSISFLALPPLLASPSPLVLFVFILIIKSPSFSFSLFLFLYSLIFVTLQMG